MWNLWKLSFFAIPYLVFAVEWMLIRAALPRPCAARRFLAAFGLVAASKFAGFQTLGGNSFNPELPVWLLFAWGWLESVVWIALPVGLCAAVSLWLWRRVGPHRGCVPTNRFTVWMVFAVSAVFSVYGMYEGMRIPSVVEREVVLDDLPEAFNGYRIVHLSDLHCSSAARRDKIAGIVERANSCDADLIAITGDFVDGFPARREKDLEPLKDLRARDGVLASTGNHEKYWRIGVWEPYYAKWNVRLLRNTWTEIRRGEASIVVGGMDDVVVGAHPGAVYAGAPAGSFRVLLYHHPCWCEANESIHDVRLQLSGHTHGGAMPIIDRFVARCNDGHLKGLYRIGRLVLHVSPGSGQWAGFPLRLFNPPEITVLTLVRGKGVAGN